MTTLINIITLFLIVKGDVWYLTCTRKAYAINVLKFEVLTLQSRIALYESDV